MSVPKANLRNFEEPTRPYRTPEKTVKLLTWTRNDREPIHYSNAVSNRPSLFKISAHELAQVLTAPDIKKSPVSALQ